MRKKKKKEIKSLDEIEVKLKNIGNIRPGVYLTVLYALALVIIVFLVFFLPGIRNPGSEIQFTTIPESAAVYVDGKYVGTTPCEQFISAGKREIQLGKNGYTLYQDTVDIEKRLFASFIFPKQQSISILLEPESVTAPLREAFTQFSDWAGINSFHYRYQPEPVISTTVEGLYYGKAAVDDETMQQFFTALAPYVRDEAMLKDFIRGYLLYCSDGHVLTPSSLLDTLASLVRVQEDLPLLPFWTAASLSSEKAAPVLNSNWFNSARTEYFDKQKPAATATTNTGELQRITIEGIDFVFIPDGTYSLGATEQDSFPVLYTSHPFYICSTEINYRQFSRFLEENPDFAPSAISTLSKQGLVTDDYLQSWEQNKHTDLPVSYVSYFVAEEFCKWLETKLPDYVKADFSVQLPNEYQWETAASISSLEGSILHDETTSGPKPVNRNGGPILSDFYGNLWEWCHNWYAPSDFVLFQNGGEKIVPDPGYAGVEKSVRGGSWATMEDLVSISSRGSQPPHWCTPFLGFRPAIVPKK